MKLPADTSLKRISFFVESEADFPSCPAG